MRIPVALALAVALAGCASSSESTRSEPAPVSGATSAPGATSLPDPAAADAPSPSDPAAAARPAADSKTDPHFADAKKCLKDRGCPAGTTLPKCSEIAVTADYVGVTLEALNKARAKYKGMKIGVSGPLASSGPSACTEMGCPADYPCCNSCSGSLVLGKPDAEFKTSLLLRSKPGDDVESPDDYTCKGDDTAVCCKYTPGGEVTAYGTLVAPKGAKAPYVLAGAFLCSL